MGCYICASDAEFKQDLARDADGFVCECERCGKYSIARGVAEGWEAQLTEEERLGLSAAIRDASDRGRRLSQPIDKDSYRALASAVPAPHDALDQLDMLLDAIASRTRTFGEQTPSEDAERWAARLFFRDRKSLVQMASAMVGMGLIQYQLDGQQQRRVLFGLTFTGWQQARDVRKRRGHGTQAFVAMWFHPEFAHVFDDAIGPALKDTGYSPYRVDLAHHNNRIDDEIVAQLRRSRLVVAEATGARASVYYEAGFAHGLGLTVIWCCNTSYGSFQPDDRPDLDLAPTLTRKSWFDRVAFDTRQYNFIAWSTVEELRKRLTARVRGLGLDLTE